MFWKRTLERRVEGIVEMHVEIISDWKGVLRYFAPKQKDVYFSEQYVRLAASKEDTPLCTVCEENDKILLMPFLRRTVGKFFDFETPYGYGGPISNTDDTDWNKRAVKELVAYFASHDYLAGFVRFHPLLDNANICRDGFSVIDDRKTIAIDTSASGKNIWQEQISSKNRNMIRKAERNGLSFVRDDGFRYIEEFKRLYNSTMNRIGAENFYFFDDTYYERFTDIFRDKGFLGCITKNNEIISAALFMYDGNYGHYHLAGSDRRYSSLGANNLLLWKVACEMHQEGVKEFHLGGGNSGDAEDSLFRFKRSFSPNLRQFSIGKMVFNKEAYDSVCADWEKANPGKVGKYGNRLLKYRY